MWFDDMDIGGRGIVRQAVGPLGRSVRQARLDLCLSQERVARAVGVSQQAVSRLELGHANWKLFCQILETLGSRPKITLEPILSDREVVDRYLAGEEIPPDFDALVPDDLW